MDVDDSVFESFGIELEGVYKRGFHLNLLDSLKDAGNSEATVNLENVNYSDDASLSVLSSASGDRCYTYEYKYWDYNTDKGFRNMKLFLDILYSNMTEINSTCGLHIHLKPKKDKDLSALYYTASRYKILESYIDNYIGRDYVKIDKSDTHPNLFGLIFYNFLARSVRDNGCRIWKVLSNSSSDIESPALVEIEEYGREKPRVSVRMVEKINPDYKIISFLTEDEYKKLKYAQRLVNSFSICNTKFSEAISSSHYDFINIVGSLSEPQNGGTIEFRLMPYADSPEEAIESIKFAINELSKVVNMYENGELSGYFVSDYDNFSNEVLEPLFNRDRKSLEYSIRGSSYIKKDTLHIIRHRVKKSKGVVVPLEHLGVKILER
jgi:hypothetical protein